jgi:hypothetical protein
LRSWAGKVFKMEKTCQNCGKPLIKRKYESKARFAKKKYCSSACSYAWMKEQNIGWWANRGSDFDTNISKIDPSIE